MMSIEPRPCQRHPQETTRLGCSHCNAPICPKCMVQTEVGIKCPDCIKSIKSHVLEIAPRQYLIVGVLALLAGVGYGLLHGFFMSMPFQPFGIPVLGLFVAFVFGQVMGRGIQRVLKQKLGRLLTLCVMLGFVAGLIVGPFSPVLLSLGFFVIDLVQNPQVAELPGGSVAFYVVGRLIELTGPYCCLRGLAQAFQPR